MIFRKCGLTLTPPLGHAGLGLGLGKASLGLSGEVQGCAFKAQSQFP
jgi:hypothetical protein